MKRSKVTVYAALSEMCGVLSPETQFIIERKWMYAYYSFESCQKKILTFACSPSQNPILMFDMSNVQHDPLENFACWVFFHAFVFCLLTFFKINFFSKYSFKNAFSVSHSSDPDLDPNCLQRLSADNTSMQRAKATNMHYCRCYAV